MANIIKTTNIHTDNRGTLIVYEKILPFEVKRSYIIYGKKGCVRGGHSHIITKQALVSLNGVISIRLKDSEIQLCNPDEILVLNPEDWHEMFFVDDAILLVFASEYYNPNDYV